MVDEKQIEPHVSVCDKTQRNDESLSSSDFQWDEQADEYRCPQGHVLRRRWRRVQEPAYPRHQGRHHHLSIQPIRLRELPDEGALLSEYTDSKDRSQRP